MEAIMANIPLTCTLVGAVGILFSIILAGIVKSAPAGDDKMQEIAGAIQEGAIAYLNRQLKSMGIAGIIIFGVIAATWIACDTNTNGDKNFLAIQGKWF